MHQLVFATNNPHKLRELEEILKGEFSLLSLSDISCTDDIPETGDTLEANASQKSFHIWDRYGIDCFFQLIKFSSGWQLRAYIT